MTLRSVLFSILLFFVADHSFAQFFDLNIINPKVNIGAHYQSPSANLNHQVIDYNLGIMIPVYSKFSTGLDFNQLLTKNPIKNTLKTFDPKMTQILATANVNYSNVTGDLYGSRKLEIGKFNAGITGIHLSLKGIKPRAFIWSVFGGMAESIKLQTQPLYAVKGLVGYGGVANLKTIWFIGVYSQYYGNQFFGTPVVAINGRFKIKSKWRYTIVLPKEIKLTYKFSEKWKQDLVVGLDNNQFRGATDLFGGNRYALQSFINLKVATQARLKLSKKAQLYFEGGYYIAGRSIYNYSNSSIIFTYPDSGSIFARFRINIAIGKSLLSSSKLNLEI